MKSTRYTFTGPSAPAALDRAIGAALLAVDGDRVMEAKGSTATRVLRITGDVPAQLDRELLALGATKNEH